MSPTPENTALAVLSGGLDSTTACILAMEKFDITHALTFDYGQRAALREIQAAKSFCEKYNIEHLVIPLPWLAALTNTSLVNRQTELPSYKVIELGINEDREHQTAKAVWVPNRNGVFLAISAAHAESLDCSAIIVGFNAEEAATFPDNSKSFMDISNEGLKYSTQNHVQIIAPTIGMNKMEILKNAVDLGVDLSMLWSCYEGGENPCGVCESCARTLRAKKAAPL
ncbi:MAG: 7-cyano-7-deazaguanine synthase QueC [Deltaproteobacteria bacterium]|nr:7-cyano-7-deazaguanine synthase QueC [Deltaproteobacteria bacterium]